MQHRISRHSRVSSRTILQRPVKTLDGALTFQQVIKTTDVKREMRVAYLNTCPRPLWRCQEACQQCSTRRTRTINNSQLYQGSSSTPSALSTTAKTTKSLVWQAQPIVRRQAPTPRGRTLCSAHAKAADGGATRVTPSREFGSRGGEVAGRHGGGKHRN